MLDERRSAKRKNTVFVLTTPHKVWAESLKECMVRDGLNVYLYGERLPLDLDLLVINIFAPYEFDTDQKKCFSRGKIIPSKGKKRQFTVFVPIPENKGTWQPLLATAVVSEVKKHFRL
ncbi:MAG: hypothetical protein QG589_418 [Patescibacteria group bacterium]|nr:hypothetical protein [Patescibacteria group bacterium]